MRKRLVAVSIVLLLAITLIGCSADEGSSEVNEEPKIILGKTPWTSSVPSTEIAKIVLQDMGYDVVEEEAELGIIFAGLDTGDISVFLDYWEPQHKYYLKKFEERVEIISTIYDDAAWGLAVPGYMEDVNDVGDLKGLEDELENEVLAIEKGDPAVEDIPKVIDRYDLDMKMINSSEAAMLVAVKTKIEQEEPVVFLAWRPHSMFQLFDIKLLTKEKAEEYFNSATVYAVANKSLKDDAPEAYEFLSNWEIDINDVEKMITKIDEGEAPEEVAQEWIDENEDKINEMIGIE